MAEIRRFLAIFPFWLKANKKVMLLLRKAYYGSKMINGFLTKFPGLFLLTMILVSGCTQQPGESPSDFDLIFSYGVGAKNQLNTFNQTYSKEHK